MSALTGAEARALTDSIAKQYELLVAVIGTTGSAGTVLYGMQQNVDRIKAYTNEDPRVDLEKIFSGEKDLAALVALRIDNDPIRALENHIRRIEDMSFGEYWEEENYPTYRIAYGFAIIARAIGLYIAPELVYPPVTSMGTFVASGEGAGTFTDASAIDLDLYGAADLEVYITAKGGTSVTLTATITGLDENGSVITGTATVVAADVGDSIAVVPADAGRRFADVTDVTIKGGAAGDAFTVRSKVDRSISL